MTTERVSRNCCYSIQGSFVDMLAWATVHGPPQQPPSPVDSSESHYHRLYSSIYWQHLASLTIGVSNHTIGISSSPAQLRQVWRKHQHRAFLSSTFRVGSSCCWAVCAGSDLLALGATTLAMPTKLYTQKVLMVCKSWLWRRIFLMGNGQEYQRILQELVADQSSAHQFTQSPNHSFVSK